MAVARIEIRVLVDDLVVHEYRRSTTMLQLGSSHKMMDDALGWFQAYAGQVSNDQLLMEARRAAQVQELSESSLAS
jgi:hypothetical protein